MKGKHSHRWRKRSLGILLSWAVLLCSAPEAWADIDLEYRVVSDTVQVGEMVACGLFAVSDDDTNQSFSAMEVIFGWDPDFLGFLGIDGTGAVSLQASFLPYPDGTGLNEANPPEDGDGLYIAWAPLGNPVDATPEGVLLTTFLFEALAPTPFTSMSILEEWGTDPVYETFIVDGEIPGLIVTGILTGAAVEIISSCPEDITGPDGSPDGLVDVLDLLAVLSQWGGSGSADITGEDGSPDGIVDVLDLLAVLSAWGPCP